MNESLTFRRQMLCIKLIEVNHNYDHMHIDSPSLCLIYEFNYILLDLLYLYISDTNLISSPVTSGPLPDQQTPSAGEQPDTTRYNW